MKSFSVSDVFFVFVFVFFNAHPSCCPPAQLETLKEQNSKYQEELSLSQERSSSEDQRLGVLRKEM